MPIIPYHTWENQNHKLFFSQEVFLFNSRWDVAVWREAAGLYQ